MANQHTDRDLRLNSYRALDPESGCRCCTQQLADGRYAVQFDNDEPILKTAAELMAEAPLPVGVKDPRWIVFELLRRHLCTAHPDMSYVELASR